MGFRREHAGVLDWMSTLDKMKAHGTIIRASCQGKDCRHWWDWPVDDLIRQIGSDKASVWDRQPPCERCGAEILFLVSPGRGTPFRPLMSTWIPEEGLPIQSLMDGWIGLRRP